MSSSPSDPSLAAGQSSTIPTPSLQCRLDTLRDIENPKADIILVGDISKIPSSDIWGTDFFWPEQIPNVSVYQFVYLTQDRFQPRRGDLNALGDAVSTNTLEQRSNELRDAVNNHHNERKAAHVILVGYGYGGLLCEQSFEEIEAMQGSFFDLTEDGSRIASCFPSSGPSYELTILPEWSTVPNTVPVMVRKPYLEMTKFKNAEEKEFKVISGLIRKWITNKDKAGTNDSAK
ncbi:hypothetical protein F5X97DRAFT_322652 [Nemania serpens]|nr:hypothetical protein F5X97DRAFT_322652 [Nemania serpens]